MAMEKALTTAEAADALGVSKQTVYRYINEGKLRSHMAGRLKRIPESQIADLLGVKCTTQETREENIPGTVITMKPGEDKETICRKLIPALQATRHYADLTQLYYEKRTGRLEVVTAEFESGEKVSINVSGDSGISLIRDVIRGLNYASEDGGVIR